LADPSMGPSAAIAPEGFVSTKEWWLPSHSAGTEGIWSAPRRGILNQWAT
jgi:hypothetical protein